MSDTFKTFQKAQIDPGTLTFSVAYDPDDTDMQTLNSELADSTSVPTWRITLPDIGAGSDTESFTGYVQGISREVQKDSLIMASITIKVSGDPGFSTS